MSSWFRVCLNISVFSTITLENNRFNFSSIVSQAFVFLKKNPWLCGGEKNTLGSFCFQIIVRFVPICQFLGSRILSLSRCRAHLCASSQVYFLSVIPLLNVCNAWSISSITKTRGKGRGRAEMLIPGNFICNNWNLRGEHEQWLSSGAGVLLVLNEVLVFVGW